MAARTQANGNSRRLSACQRRAAVERTWHRAPGVAAAVWYLRGSGADGQSAFSDWDVAHGRTRGEIHWARRLRDRCARGAPGGSPCGAERARCRAAAFGSLDKVTRIVRLGVSVATVGDVREHPKVA